MTDVLTRAQRTFNMTRIKGKDTKPEMLIRRGLHALGLRYRLHSRRLPGSPDLVFRRHSAVIFVHGCFWHRHACRMFKMPSTRRGFWAKKIAGNAERDAKTVKLLRRQGWRVMAIWECALRGKRRLELRTVLKLAHSFLRGDRNLLELKGG
jgi:DNA mismatch endonuclease (patch repair protein)